MFFHGASLPERAPGLLCCTRHHKHHALDDTTRLPFLDASESRSGSSCTQGLTGAVTGNHLAPAIASLQRSSHDHEHLLGGCSTGKPNDNIIIHDTRSPFMPHRPLHLARTARSVYSYAYLRLPHTQPVKGLDGKAKVCFPRKSRRRA